MYCVPEPLKPFTLRLSVLWCTADEDPNDAGSEESKNHRTATGGAGTWLVLNHSKRTTIFHVLYMYCTCTSTHISGSRPMPTEQICVQYNDLRYACGCVPVNVEGLNESGQQLCTCMCL